MIDLDELARLEREANAEQEAEDAAGVEGCNVHSEDGMWPTTARAALIAAMRNALPGLLEMARVHQGCPYAPPVTYRARAMEAESARDSARAEVERLRHAILDARTHSFSAGACIDLLARAALKGEGE